MVDVNGPGAGAYGRVCTACPQPPTPPHLGQANHRLEGWFSGAPRGWYPNAIRQLVAVGAAAGWISAVAVVNAAELKAKTLEAWERYVRVTEARMQTELVGQAPFLWVDSLADDEREKAYAGLRDGEIVIERRETRDGDLKIDIPDGKVHHWIGTVLIRGVTLDQTIALVQDYDRYAEIYSPDVRESRLLNRDGSRFRVYFQFFTKKVWTVVLNTEHDVEYQYLDAARVHVPSHSTRILEVEHPDTPDEREKLEGNDRGTMWRFNNDCSFEARDGDIYMQCESISLSRGIPFLVRPFVGPFVNGLPRDKLTSNLDATRRHLTQ